MKPIKLIFILTACILLNFEMNAQTLSLTSSNYNGFNVSCFGEKNGSIDLTITGGTPPYMIIWSTSDSDEDLDSLPAGYYRVVVDDADTLTGPVAAEITLTEPRKIEAEIFIHTYNDRYNISAFDACNGIISFQPAGGVSPYQYLWNDNNTTNNRSNLCADRYIFVIEDANQCKYKSEYIILVQPDRNDWQMNGNENTDPLTHFIGTMDSIDFVFRTNGIERLRIGANGAINFGNNLNVGNTLNFSNNKVIDYREADATSPEVMSFGNRINSSLQGVLCSPTQATAYFQFSGLLQSWGNANSGGNVNMMQFGFDGENSVIDAAGNNSGTGNHRLLLNYNCGKDVFVGNTTLGGNLTANNNLYILDKVGIQTSEPKEVFQIGDRFVLHNGVNKGIGYNFYNEIEDKKLVDGTSAAIFFTPDGDIKFSLAADGAEDDAITWADVLKIDHSGYVCVAGAIVDPNYSLNVCGAIKASKILLDANWCDYVFADDYSLMSLGQLREFINLNKHLPEIPSEEVVETKGLEVANMIELQMKKIEELTLYILELESRISTLEKK